MWWRSEEGFTAAEEVEKKRKAKAKAAEIAMQVVRRREKMSTVVAEGFPATAAVVEERSEVD